MSTSTASAPTATTVARRARRNRLLLLAGLGLVALSITRVISGEGVLTASGTINAMVWLTLPVALAGLGGLISERAGVVNIGLEGMMMLGVWGAGFAGWRWGPLAALVAALIGGALGGLLHALATVTFGVDHIVSGVAINLLAAGTVRFLSELTFIPSTGGGPTQSPPMSGNIPTFDIPVLASGPDVLGSVERTGIPVLADAAGVLRGLMVGITPYELLGLAMFPLTAYLLWRTALGLRLRSAGENPWAAESLGVNVVRVKYLAVVWGGALAGLGGLFLVMFTGSYREGMTNGRGYIGLAAMIFGNWRPGGLAAGATLFGYADAVRLRSQNSLAVLALFIFAGIVVIALGVLWLRRGRRLPGAIFIGIGVTFLLGYLGLDSLPNEVTTLTPYIVTLVVLSVSSQNLRMPKADGMVYRKGEGH
ncbi:MAG TPA: ABC transporter permease [Dermatophilaceae bacterium]|jgi:simple sugar transport system permease protein|uniref:ABC transporter permease n=1 Tax=Candidatus Phosphoribacter hodrii TaxID=2953743 RepID=A0A935CCG6_9MICO|nr:ABC transporter permease [Candidatus Phosphoribacter hodrii]HRC65048.1 ABC transporter permease [Dermatophilaceae bacterium]